MRISIVSGIACLVLAACTGTARLESEAIHPPSTDPAAAAYGGRAAELESAARELIAFLRGEATFGRVRLADTVTLYISPEGGGTRATFTRGQLRDPARWRVASGGMTYSFVPPASTTKVTTRAGSHFNCREYPLSSRVPDLARLPHVGVKLALAGAESCLQTWNVTFVFDPAARPARLVAAVYDQWEW